MPAVTPKHQIDPKSENHCRAAPDSTQSTRVCTKPAGKVDPFTGANCNFKAIESVDDVRCGRARENCGCEFTR